MSIVKPDTKPEMKRLYLQSIPHGRAVYRSRWGFHPCDYQTFVKLKKLHKRFWEIQHASAKRVRWECKTVHRHGEEPPIPKGRLDWRIRWAYVVARRPQSCPNSVPPMVLSQDEINTIYRETFKD